MKYLYQLLLFTSFMSSSPLLATEVYKWTDKQGVLHFSDTPPPKQVKNEEKLKLPDIKAPAPAPQYSAKSDVNKPLSDVDKLKEQHNTPNKASQMADSSTPADLPNAEPQIAKPTVPKKITVTINNLVEDQTIRSNRGLMTIQAVINRHLDIGEQLQLLLDTQPYGAPQTKPLWELKNVNRGTHTFSINIVENGKVIASSHPITVHLHRTTVK
ncbi:MAG: DUF4124 domain-containing protein [Vibrio casei]